MNCFSGYNNCRKTNKGFTIIELMITIALIGILTTIAAPSMRHWARESTIRTRTENMVALLDEARMASTQYNKPVYIIPTDLKNVYNEETSSSSRHGDWSKGIKAFVDSNYNALYDDREPVVGVLDFEGAEVKINENTIRFLPNGMAGFYKDADVLTTGFSNTDPVELTICIKSGKNYLIRQISMSTVGSTMVVSKPSSSECN